MLKQLKKLSEATNTNLLEAFTALLDYSIGFLSVPGQTKIDGWKYSEQNEVFAETFAALVQEYKKGIDLRGWCDPLGDLFMDFCAGFTSTRGQFFTPIDLCSLMAELSLPSEQREPHYSNTPFGRRSTISDPTCGSGRNLLASYHRATSVLHWERKPYIIGEDVDPLCVKMTALNLCVHGCFGEVICHNTLTDVHTCSFGYIINEAAHPFPTPVPSIRRSTNPRDFYACQWPGK